MNQTKIKTIITTSRNPSPNLLKFTKELKKIFPFSRRINRGNKYLKSLINFCLLENATDLILVHENRGNPSSLIISHLPSGPTLFFRLSKILMTVSQKNTHISSNFPLIIIDNLTSPLGKRLAIIFKNLFPPPSQKSKKIIILCGQGDFISFRYYWFERRGNLVSNILLHDIFPNFDLYPFKISLSILCDTKTEIEWSIKSFTNTFKKKFII